jgi:hypothetical protein
VCSDDFVPRLRESGTIRLLAGRAQKHGHELGSGLALHAEQRAKFSPQRHRDTEKKTFWGFLCVSGVSVVDRNELLQLIRAIASGTIAPL